MHILSLPPDSCPALSASTALFFLRGLWFRGKRLGTMDLTLHKPFNLTQPQFLHWYEMGESRIDLKMLKP